MSPQQAKTNTALQTISREQYEKLYFKGREDAAGKYFVSPSHVRDVPCTTLSVHLDREAAFLLFVPSLQRVLPLAPSYFSTSFP